jgi:hypothetical protein
MRSVTIIGQDKVRAIATKLGLQVKDKKGEFKVFGEAGIGKSIAIPNTKGGATRIYLVGFAIEGEGFVSHPKPPAKTVTVMVDHSLDEKLVLKAVFKACKALASAVKAAPAPVVTEAPASSPEPVVETAPEALSA